MVSLEEGDACLVCKNGQLEWLSVHRSDGCCSCHINPPCSYCTDTELACKACDEVAIEYVAPVQSKYQSKPWKPKPFEPVSAGNGRITGYSYDGRSGSTMVFKGTYDGEVTNEDLLKYFGTGTFGHRFGWCANGSFQFTKITD